jgi:hypothetical protein
MQCFQRSEGFEDVLNVVTRRGLARRRARHSIMLLYRTVVCHRLTVLYCTVNGKNNDECTKIARTAQQVGQHVSGRGTNL